MSTNQAFIKAYRHDPPRAAAPAPTPPAPRSRVHQAASAPPLAAWQTSVEIVTPATNWPELPAAAIAPKQSTPAIGKRPLSSFTATAKQATSKHEIEVAHEPFGTASQPSRRKQPSAAFAGRGSAVRCGSSTPTNTNKSPRCCSTAHAADTEPRRHPRRQLAPRRRRCHDHAALPRRGARRPQDIDSSSSTATSAHRGSPASSAPSRPLPGKTCSSTACRSPKP